MMRDERGLLIAAIRQHSEILTCDVDELIGYVNGGNLTAAGELLSCSALLQESCMNQGRADAIWALCDRLDYLTVN